MRELKQFALILMESNVFKNNNACGTRSINHKMKAMKKLNNKFGAFAAHLENVISGT